MAFDFQRARPLLHSGNLAKLFVEELGWEPCRLRDGPPGVPFTPAAALDYFNALPPATKELALQYIRTAPPQTVTAFRRLFNAANPEN